ncbi:hypothetical protein [Litorimonas sp.]|uniref:hypothetical protein n=1 Tax=Litorimonas sp. TaxID=1892381 RepID=UPI003A8A14F1
MLKSRKVVSDKSLFGIIFSYVLMTIGIIFLGCAAFLFLQDQFSTEISFTVLGILTLIVALILHLRAKNKLKPKEEDMPVGLEDDPLSAFLPDIIKENETVKNLVSQVSHNPIMATAAAVTLGMLLSREFFED